VTKHIFGKTLKQRRQQLGLSQEKLALECGLSSYYVVLLEQGKRQPTLTTLFKLSSSLCIDPNQLIDASWSHFQDTMIVATDELKP